MIFMICIILIYQNKMKIAEYICRDRGEKLLWFYFCWF